MYKIECSYCKESFDVYDWEQYNQDDLFENICSHCNKILIVSFSFIPIFDINKASCKNGGDHKLIDIKGFLKSFVNIKKDVNIVVKK